MRALGLRSLTFFSLVVAVGCDANERDVGPDGGGTTTDAGEDSGSDADASDGGSSESSDGEAPVVDYEVRGRVDRVLAAPPERGLAGTAPMAFERCPFEEGSEPCVSEACEDPSSEACQDVIEAHCEGSPDDPGCVPAEEPEEAFFEPSSLSLLVHKVEFSTDAEGCSDPFLVGEPEEPHYVDFTTGPELVDAVVPPEGAYPCVIITMSDHIQWAVEGDSPCAGTSFQDVAGAHGVEEVVRLHLSTAGDSESEDFDPFSAPGLRLGNALQVGPGAEGSAFVVSFPGGVRYREGYEVECDLQKPVFDFVNTF